MKNVVLAALLLGGMTGAGAFDRIALTAGRGGNVDVFGVALGTRDWKRWPLGESWQLSAYGMASAAYWHARESTENKQLYDFGLAPVLRLQKAAGAGATPYLEASLGVHLLSEKRINQHREFSTAFQFGEFVGAGMLFGERRELGIGVRLQHVSNGGIKEPNPGLTFGGLVVQYRF